MDDVLDIDDTIEKELAVDYPYIVKISIDSYIKKMIMTTKKLTNELVDKLEDYSNWRIYISTENLLFCFKNQDDAIVFALEL